MRIIVAGIYKYPMYQEALASGLESIGQEVCRVVLLNGHSWNQRVAYKNSIIVKKAVDDIKPDCLFLYRAEIIFAYTLKQLRKQYPQLKIFIYHNDDPFRNTLHRRLKSFHYLRCVKYADITYVYRPVNIEEAKQWGAKQVKLYMSHYYSKTDLKDYTREQLREKNGRVVFLGHFENDSRISYFDELFKSGVNFHIYGPENWKEVFVEHKWPLSQLHDIVRGAEYVGVIRDSSIALAFFSTANRDEYTRRCFEIPISGTALLQQRTNVTSALFKDKYNCLLFDSKEEFMEKIAYYLIHDKELANIAWNGYQYVKNGDFSEISRAKMVLNDYEQLNDIKI